MTRIRRAKPFSFRLQVFLQYALMASYRLGSAALSKGEVADEGAAGNGEHDPAVVGHEQEPMFHENGQSRLLSRSSWGMQYYSHDEERVEDLDGVQRGADDLDALLLPGGPGDDGAPAAACCCSEE